MAPDLSKVDLVLQYTILAAGEEDELSDRQLGPIHLIKYVYLADLIYARWNNGTTFTGTPWKFYKFGPWSQEVNARITPALTAINAEKISFPSDYGDKDDWVRWSIKDEQLAEMKERSLPSVITGRLKRDIHKFGKDTPGLLDYVYTTRPMLAAAPNEYLDFSLAIEDGAGKPRDSVLLGMNQLSTKKRKAFQSGMFELQQKQKSRSRTYAQLIIPVAHPRYDEIFNDGIKWLDQLAGEPIPSGEVVAEFSPDVWKSSTRKGVDVS